MRIGAALQVYLDGDKEQFWLRDQIRGIIFLITAGLVEELTKFLKVWLIVM